MKALAALVLMFCTPQLGWGSCEFKTGVKANPDGSYTYSRECHIEVGLIRERLQYKTAEADELRRAVELKDLAYKSQAQDTANWMLAAQKTNDRLQSYQNFNILNQVLFFGAGVGLTVLSVWAAGQLR
jgi:hypothetical protein